LRNSTAAHGCVAPVVCCLSGARQQAPSNIAKLPISHFLGHVKNKLSIAFFRLTQQSAKLVEITGFLAGAAKSDVVRRLPLQEVRQLGRFFAFVEELIEWAFECASQLFQRLDGRDSMTIFYAGDVAAKQTGAFFDVAHALSNLVRQGR